MYNRILIPVDGSDTARCAAKRGILLAQNFDAAVDVLHVIERSTLRLTKSSDEEEKLRERGETVLNEIQGIADEVGKDVKTELAEGKPSKRITEYAEENTNDLIVMGREGQGQASLKNRLLGGVAEKILHSSEAPVLVVPDEEEESIEDSYDEILFPTDGSENAEKATKYCSPFARQYGSEVHILNVVNLQSEAGAFSAGGLTEDFIERLEQRGKKSVERAADQIEKEVQSNKVTTRVLRTESFDGPVEKIREYVVDEDIDLVVMGSHGRSNLGRQLLGSVASGVLRTVDVPVLTVKR